MRVHLKAALLAIAASVLALSPVLSGAMAWALPPGAAEHHEIMFERGRGGMAVLEVALNGQGPFRFAVDTGAPGPLRLDTAVAEQLALRPVRHEAEGDGSGQNEFTVPVVEIARLGVGTFEKVGLEANVMDLRGRGFEFDGVFGMDAFAEHLLTIDYRNGKVAIDSGSLPPANGRDIVDYELTADGLIKLPVRIGRQTLAAYLDTGQTMTGILVPEAVALAAAASAPTPAGQARTVSNSYPMFEVALDGSASVAGILLPVQRVRYPSIGAEANIGSLALVGAVLRLDQRNRRLQILFAQ